MGSLLALAAAAASAGEPKGCTDTDEAELRSWVLDAQAAIDRGDTEMPAAILAEVDRRIPCFTFVVPPRLWADLELARAIVEYARQGDWEAPMAAALRIRPTIDRGVGVSHPLFRWEPPSPPPAGPPVPPIAGRFYVDGLASPVLPSDRGRYLVQKTDALGRYVNSRVVEDEDLPVAWVEAPVELPPRIASWGRIGPRFGGGTLVQDPSWDSDVFPPATPSDLFGGVGGDAQITFYSPFGVMVHGDLGWFRAPVLDGRLAGIGTWRGLTGGLGLGRQSVIVDREVYTPTERDPFAHHTVWDWQTVQYGFATAMVRAPGEVGGDLGGTIGMSAAAFRFELTFGVTVPLGSERVRVGAWVDSRTGRFYPQGLAQKRLDASLGTLSLSLEWIRGDY